MKRVLFIAAMLEVLKHLVVSIFSEPPDNALGFILFVIIFVGFLPEMMIGGEHPPHHWYTVLARLCVGVVWNLPLALYISKCLPDSPNKPEEIIESTEVR